MANDDVMGIGGIGQPLLLPVLTAQFARCSCGCGAGLGRISLMMVGHADRVEFMGR